MQTSIRFEHAAQLTVVGILLIGCFLVLRPFLAAMLFAAVVCSSTWPVFLFLRRRLGDSSAIAATVLSLAIIVLIAGPVALLAGSLADSIPPVVDWLKGLLDRGPIELPTWLTGLPLVGDQINQYWKELAAGREELASLMRRLINPTKDLLLGAAAIIGEGLLQILLAVFIAFFFYRDGEVLMWRLRAVSNRLAGAAGEELVDTTRNTVTSVAYGLIGTAIVQAIVATLGFAIAGVPAVLLLGAATFVLSMIPLGPPVIWGGAALWLYQQNETGWAIFLVLYGALVISSVDNFIKPYLISRTASISLFMVVLGVFGGALAFGFIGIFIGPTLLALADSLASRWLERRAAAAPGHGHDGPAEPPGPEEQL